MKKENKTEQTKKEKPTEKELEEFVTNDLYRIAGRYAATNPIVGMDVEDYVQELVLDFWTHRHDYDPNRAPRITTFCYCRFRAVKWALQTKMYKQYNTISLDRLVDDDGHSLIDLIADKREDIALSSIINSMLEKVAPETQMYLYGFKKQYICKRFLISPERLNKILNADMKYLRKMCKEEGIS